jgi:hypothetical protein
MSLHHESSRLAVGGALLLALSSYGCYDGATVETAIGPSSFEVRGPAFVNQGVSIHAADIVPLLAPGARCPIVPPFLAPIDLAISTSASDLLLREIRMQFVDSAGTVGGFRSIIGNELGTLLGSAHLPPAGTRSIPLSLPFGCVGGRTGTMGVLVVAVDSHDRERRMSIQVPVR